MRKSSNFPLFLALLQKPQAVKSHVSARLLQCHHFCILFLLICCRASDQAAHVEKSGCGGGKRKKKSPSHVDGNKELPVSCVLLFFSHLFAHIPLSYIVLLGQGIPSTCEDSLNYSIKQTSYTKSKIIGNYTHPSCGNPNCDVEVDQRAHKLFLTIADDESLVAEKSVYVPAVEESAFLFICFHRVLLQRYLASMSKCLLFILSTGLPQVTDIQTSAREGDVKVSWMAPAQPVSGYVIDWTHNGKQYNWMKSAFTNATLFGMLDRRERANGMKWMWENST